MRRYKRISIHHIGDVGYFGLNNFVSKRGLNNYDSILRISADTTEHNYRDRCRKCSGSVFVNIDGIGLHYQR